MSKPEIFGGKVNQGHLRRYIQETIRGAEVAPVIERIVANAEFLLEPRPTINYILGSPVDNPYQSKHQKRRLLRAATD